MESKKHMNRGLVVVGAILIQLCAGAIYAWSAYTKALGDTAGIYKLSTTETQAIFSVGLATFALVMVFAGNWQKKSCPKTVALTGGIVLGLGYILAGLFGAGADHTSTFIRLAIFIGLIGGAGIGLVYVCPIACGVKWFPDKKGLITGLAVAGFGFGATIWVKFAGGMPSFGWPGGLLANLHFINNSGVQSTWFVYGIIYLVAITVGALWMVNPPEGYCPINWTPPTGAKAADSGGVEYDQFHMLRTPQFYMIWFCFIAGALAGLMIIGVIATFINDSLQAGGATSAMAAAVGGTAMGVFYALANGIGRIAWGTWSDKIGRKRAIQLMCLIQGLALLTFWFVGKSVPGLYIWATLIGFNFGGNFALYPAITADYFGNKTVGTNYGWMFTAYGVGGIIGPLLAGYYKDLVKETSKTLTAGSPEFFTANYQTWMTPFMIAGVLCIIAVVVISLTQKPVKLEKAAT
jgi:MFS transporter, OFA family, oxalate/formate antiporter